ncbi:hypothetical protein HanHA300_Chr00c0085g0706241 [Helianthus annuus]|nr:hypothetical protein HanHA300_Chr00c0085g0706241 [Helianthus annuus]
MRYQLLVPFCIAGTAGSAAAAGGAAAASSAALTTNLEPLELFLEENITMLHLTVVVLDITFGATTNPTAADAMLQLAIISAKV